MMEIGNTEFIIRMIRKNRGISYLPLFAVREYAENGELTILDAADFRLAMYQQVIYHKNKWMTKEMDQTLREMWDYYLQLCYPNSSKTLQKRKKEEVGHHELLPVK